LTYIQHFFVLTSGKINASNMHFVKDKSFCVNINSPGNIQVLQIGETSRHGVTNKAGLVSTLRFIRHQCIKHSALAVAILATPSTETAVNLSVTTAAYRLCEAQRRDNATSIGIATRAASSPASRKVAIGPWHKPT
jgi:hypothetical protein